MRKFFFLILVLAAAVFVALPAYEHFSIPYGPSSEELIAKGGEYQVRILRDTWGVPHIFGQRDPDTAYGLGFAHAEDDFLTILEGVLLVRGELAAHQGKEAAPGDYLVKLLRIWDLLADKYESDLAPETRAICEAYADGLNHYAALHRDLVPRGVLPFTGQDVVAGFVFKGPFFYGLDNRIEELFGSERRRSVSEKKQASGWIPSYRTHLPWGSNAFAVSPKRTPDGKTFLGINSHQPWDGPVAWYEAHLHSEEGWNTAGGLFPGTPVILVGHNENLGWAHTVNKPDLVDTYVLETHPDNPDQYLFDGEWRDLEVREVGIQVKLWGPFSWTFKREALWSVYGPTVRQDHGVYSIRYSGREDIRQVEQWFRMNKARNYEEFQNAMKMRAIPSLNCVYADREGNIEYLYNTRAPLRAEGYDWEQYLPGSTSETLWEDIHPYENLPRVTNPESGYVISCNNTPFRVTSEADNLDPAAFPATMGIETHMTNRSLRALELYEADESITWEDFLRIKYDKFYSRESSTANLVREVVESASSEDPLIRECLEVLADWDLGTATDNTRAALSLLAIQPDPDGETKAKTVEEVVANLKRFGPVLLEHHGTLLPPWGEVNRLVRGKADLPLAGGADTLRAIYSIFEIDGKIHSFEDGTLEAKGGDAYYQMVEWDSTGKRTSWSLHQYGSATRVPESPHYEDQAPLFAREEMKPEWLTEEEIRAHLEREYRPGE
jgi:penicillin amidase/acyl-homoserine-lactone acylase